jgi:hypothetical protein
MSKMKRGTLDSAAMIAFLVFLALIAFIIPGLFLLFFAPIAGYYLWTARDSVRDLQKRVSQLENPGQDEPKKGE